MYIILRLLFTLAIGVPTVRWSAVRHTATYSSFRKTNHDGDGDSKHVRKSAQMST